MERLARRRPEAVRELERLQQSERTAAGDPELSTAEFLRLHREDVRKRAISTALARGSLAASIAGFGTSRDVDAEAEALLRAWRLDDPSQWSRFEPPGTRWGIADICGRVERVFSQHGWQLAEVPVVGTLATGQVSAATQQSRVGAPIILIDNGFFRFSGVLAQAATFGNHDVRFRGELSEAALQLVSDLVAAQTVLGSCLHMHPRKTPADFEDDVSALQDAVATFVIGHEYAHVTAGDLNAHPTDAAGRRKPRHAQEFEADQIGFIAALEGSKSPAAVGLGVFGPFLYFAGLDLLERAESTYRDRGGFSPTSTTSSVYPTPYERTVSLLKWLENSPYAEPHHEQLRAASATYHVILGAWGQIAPAFRAAQGALSQFEPTGRGPSAFPEADAFAVVTTLWQHVLARLRAG